MILSRSEVAQMTGLGGWRLVNHEMRKALLIDCVRKHLPAGAALADIGCAGGDLTIELAAIGYRMTGIDFEPSRIGRARTAAEQKSVAVRFIHGDLREAAHAGLFDALILGEVLEHFSAPRAVLSDNLQYVKPGGLAIITVPNMASLRARLKLLFFGQFADHNPEHLFYFTRGRFLEHFSELPIDVLELSSSIYEMVLWKSREAAWWERTMLAPLRWAMPWGGTNLVAVVRRR